MPERRRAGTREARHDAAASGRDVLVSTADPDLDAADRAHRRTQCGAVDVRDHPCGDLQLNRNPVRLAEAVVDDDDPDRAGRLRATRLRCERARPAGDECDRAAERARRQRVLLAVRICGAAAQVALDRLAVPADDRPDVDERLVAPAHAGGVWPPVWIGTCSTSAPALLNAPSAGEKTCEFETAATEIASGAVLGEPDVPKPKSSRSLPAAMTGTTPAAATLSTAAISTSFSGSGLGPTAGEVDDVHAVLDRLLERVDDLGDVRRCGRPGVGTLKTR